MAKGKVNKSLKAWVTFVKSVQKKYKLSYKDAIHKAKELKDNGANWLKNKMGGGDEPEDGPVNMNESVSEDDDLDSDVEEPSVGGRKRRRRRTHKRRGSRRNSASRRRTASRRRSATRRASRGMGMVLGVA